MAALYGNSVGASKGAGIGAAHKVKDDERFGSDGSHITGGILLPDL
jgi:hypothetical protein